MRLLTRVSVLLLAVALIPLLRFVDLDTRSDPSVAHTDGVSKQDSPGIVVDRKDNLRLVTRIRAVSVSGRVGDGDGDDDFDPEYALDVETGPARSGPAASTAERYAAAPVVARSSTLSGTKSARGPPA